MENKLINLLGGKENIVSSEERDGKQYITLKDIGLADFLKIKEMTDVLDIQVNRGKAVIFWKSKIMEEKLMSKDYTELSENLIDLVGGKENIGNFMHCVTRLRFAIKDKNKVQENEIKKLKGALGCQWAGEQFQVIIGADVADVYDILCKKYGFTNRPVVEETTEKKGLKERLIAALSDILFPAMPLIIGGGMIKAVLMMALSLGWVTGGEGWFSLFMNIGDAPFYFMPFVLGYSTAKHFQIDPAYGLGIAAAMCYPALQGNPIELFGFTITATYTSTVMPIIFVVWFGSYVNKFAQKISPKLLSSFLVPIITLIVTVPLGFALIGPFFNWVSQGLCDGIMWIYYKAPVVAALLLGLSWQILIVFGMHAVFSSLATMQITAGTGTPILSMIFPAFFAQTMTVWAIYLKTKNADLKSKCMSAGISGLLGVTEPAIYSVTLPRIKYFIISCIGTAAGALVMAMTGTLRYSLGGLGFFTFPTFFGEGVDVGRVTVIVLISLLIAGGISFILTLLTYKDEGDDLI